jgi:hypothetical protein
MVGLQITGEIFTFGAGHFLSMMGFMGDLSNHTIHKAIDYRFFYA